MCFRLVKSADMLWYLWIYLKIHGFQIWFCEYLNNSIDFIRILSHLSDLNMEISKDNLPNKITSIFSSFVLIWKTTVFKTLNFSSPSQDKFQCWLGPVMQISQDLFSRISEHIYAPLKSMFRLLICENGADNPLIRSMHFKHFPASLVKVAKDPVFNRQHHLVKIFLCLFRLPFHRPHNH